MIQNRISLFVQNNYNLICFKQLNKNKNNYFFTEVLAVGLVEKLLP